MTISMEADVDAVQRLPRFARNDNPLRHREEPFHGRATWRSQRRQTWVLCRDCHTEFTLSEILRSLRSLRMTQKRMATMTMWDRSKLSRENGRPEGLSLQLAISDSVENISLLNYNAQDDYRLSYPRGAARYKGKA